MGDKKTVIDRPDITDPQEGNRVTIEVTGRVVHGIYMMSDADDRLDISKYAPVRIQRNELEEPSEIGSMVKLASGLIMVRFAGDDRVERWISPTTITHTWSHIVDEVEEVYPAATSTAEPELKYKRGDQVRCISRVVTCKGGQHLLSNYFKAGEIYKVMHENDEGVVTMRGDDGFDWCVDETCFEPVEKEV